ncbi:MAG TPA: hypothetical protein VK878_20960 [Candidatus Deferrimicrobiaceae bacterium]|nr:hypothetical protein [Candidatus Deferrimicrobiaceae bacterium]
MWASARLFLLAAVVSGCASVAPMDVAVRRSPPPDLLRFGVDTFAFANESRSKNSGKPDLYANYCFVMARAVIQFQRFARFDAAAPRVAPEEYVARVKRVVALAPWEGPRPPAERIVIPGYASLHEFSRAQEAAVKEGLVGRFWTLMHWTNWRVVLPVPRWQQERVARETLAELGEGRPVQFLVTNFPTWELNHTVVAYGYRLDAAGNILFSVYDPNDPAEPGRVTFDRAARRFEASRLYDTEQGPIRAFRMYYWALL